MSRASLHGVLLEEEAAKQGEAGLVLPHTFVPFIALSLEGCVERRAEV